MSKKFKLIKLRQTFGRINITHYYNKSYSQANCKKRRKLMNWNKNYSL